MHRRLIVLLLGFFTISAATAADAEFQWRLDEELEYVEFHDPGVLVLKDPAGVSRELDFGYVGLSLDAVSQWQSGKKMHVVYTPEQGTEIVDVESGKRFAVAGPIRIDDLLERCMKAAASMLSMQLCQGEAGAAWDLELNRAYKAALAADRSDTTKQKIRAAQRKWLGYRDASIEALAAWAEETGGSISRLEASIATVDLTRSQTHKLRLYR